MYIYQAYDGTEWNAKVYNLYLWFNCNTGRWTRSAVPSGWSSCPDHLSCAGPYPTSTTFVGSAWGACPSSGSPTCSAPHSHEPHSHSPHTHTHSPSVSHSHSPDTHSPVSSSPGGGSQVDHVCDIVNPSLAAIPQCSCTETMGGTGLVTECQESIAGLGNVGVRVQLEPCGDPAYAEMTYQFGGTSWESAGRIEAGGAPLHFPIPGAILLRAGLYISVTVAGNAADLSVHAHLSACLNGVCDGDISLVGSTLKAAGFPFPLLKFDDLAFVDSCPAESSSSNIIIIAAAAGGAVAVLLAVGFLWSYCKKKRANQNVDQVVTVTKTGPVEMTASTPADTHPTDKI